jgi:putative ABC transport system permease protein
MSPRWRKVLNDLWGNRARSALAVLAIAASVFAVGMITSSYLFIERDIDASYGSIHPAHGMIAAEPFDDELVSAVEQLPCIEKAEGRVSSPQMSIVLGADRTHPLQLVAAEDLSVLQLDRLQLLDGDWPGEMEVLVIDSQYAVTGDQLQVALADGSVARLKVSGVVRDMNIDATGAALRLRAYAGVETLESLGLPTAYTQLYFRVAGEPATDEGVRAAAREMEAVFAANGTAVAQSTARSPDQHPARATATGLLAVLAVIGVLLLALGSFLVTSMVSALLARQVRQIGIMKAIGARSGQLVGMYLVLALAFGGAALAVTVPLAPLAGYAMAEGTASLLNAALLGFRVLPEPMVLMVAVGLMMPCLAALLPLRSVMRTSVREAISTYGTRIDLRGGVINRLAVRFRAAPRPLLLSLRNAIRRRGRLALTLSALALAGAIFMAVFTVRASVVHSFDLMLPLIWSDVNIDFQQAYDTESIGEILEQVPGVQYAEAWTGATAELRDAQGDTAVDRFTVMAPPANSPLISEPPVNEGRWLSEGGQCELVISTQIELDHPEFALGDEILLHIGGRAARFVIVGKLTWIEGNPIAYASYSSIAGLLDEVGRGRTYRVVTQSSEPAFQDQVGAAVYGALRRAGYTAVVTTGAAGRGSVASGADLIATGLMVMALLTAGVGAIGLASTMGVNVLERTREIGVMRAIGASNSQIRRMVVVEGMTVGVLSWVIALGLSFPLGRLMCDGVGSALLNRPLDYVIDVPGLWAWLALVVLVSVAASLGPATNAARLAVRDALAYE